MGFFSSIGGLFGGSKSTSSSGYGALPKVAQQAMDTVTRQGSNLLLNGNGSSMFTPLATTEQEKQAYQLMQNPTTSEGVTSLVGQYLNPFTNYLTDNINKEAAGQYSLYNQALADSGQMGSNRQYINAAAADNARLNSIGTTLANNYNTAQSTALGQNQQNIANLLTQGDTERSLASQTAQAPLTALQQMAALLGVYPSTSTGKEANYGKGSLGTILGAVAGLSDIRAKENIKHVGSENGNNIYEFNYIGIPEHKFIGVIAQEVEKNNPEAVIEINGVKHVNYDMIGVEMREVA